jgi:hypothetical protein
MIKCGKCKEVKSEVYFGKNKNSKDGFNHTCKDCCSIYALSKAPHRPNLDEITMEGEVWVKISDVYDWVDDGFMISNKGRVFRTPYLNPQGSRWGGEFCDIKLRFGVPTTCVRDKNSHNMKSIRISIAIVYYKLFVNPDFELRTNCLPIYHFKDDNPLNFVNNNCLVTYSLENNKQELLSVYRFISNFYCKQNNSDFRFVGVRELSSLDEEIYLKLETKYNQHKEISFTKFPKSGGGIENIIKGCMKKNNCNSFGVVDFLKFMNVDINKEYSNTKYISNLGTICDSNIECFVRNIYEYLGLVDENFEKKSLSQIVNVKELKYNPIPDEFFIHNGTFYVSETYGFCSNDDNKDEISIIYNKKIKLKTKLYDSFGLKQISLYVHGKTYQEVLMDINEQLINFGLIKNPIIFIDEFYPKSFSFIMKDELERFFKSEGGIFSPKTLKQKNKKLYGKLNRFCEMNNFTLTEYLAKEIFKDTTITKARGQFSVVTHKSHEQIKNDVKKIVKDKNITTLDQLQEIDSSLYWRLFRMCRSNNEKISDFFIREFKINRKRKTYTYEELTNMFKDCKNRWACQQKNESQYRNAKKMGIIDILFPKN